MSTTYLAAVLRCDVTCEACNHTFTVGRTVQVSSSSVIGQAVFGSLDIQLLRKISLTIQLITARAGDSTACASQQDKFIPFCRCEKCGYLQSWMQQRWTNFNGHALGIPVAVLAVALAASFLPFPEPGWGAVLAGIGYLLAFGVIIQVAPIAFKAMCLLRPNRRWHGKNGPAVPTGRVPSVDIKPTEPATDPISWLFLE